MLSALLPNDRLGSEVHDANADVPIVKAPAPNVTLLRAEQPWNALAPIVAPPLPNVTLVSEVQD